MENLISASSLYPAKSGKACLFTARKILDSCEDVWSLYSETLQQIEAQKRWMAVTDDQRQNEQRIDTAGSGRCGKQKKKNISCTGSKKRLRVS